MYKVTTSMLLLVAFHVTSVIWVAESHGQLMTAVCNMWVSRGHAAPRAVRRLSPRSSPGSTPLLAKYGNACEKSTA